MNTARLKTINLEKAKAYFDELEAITTLSPPFADDAGSLEQHYDRILDLAYKHLDLALNLNFGDSTSRKTGNS